MIKFYLSYIKEFHEIQKEKIDNFPIKDSFLSILINNIGGFKLQYEEDAIILNSEIKYFKYVVKIYNNPELKLTEILKEDFDDLLKIFDTFEENSKYDDIYRSLYIQDKELLYKLKNHIFDDSNFKKFIKELKFFGIEKQFYKVFCSNIMDNMKEKLDEKLGELSVTEFINKISEIGGYISGSFLLNSISNDTNWISSDIDIYVHEYMLQGNFWDQNRKNRINFKTIVDFFGGTDMEIITADRNPDPHYESYCDCIGNCEKNLLFIIKFKIGETKIDLICVRSNVPRFIINNFDFSFLKSYFDGVILHIVDEKSIIKRKAVFDCYCFNNMRKLKRIQKYYERGYIVTFHLNNLDTEYH